VLAAQSRKFDRAFATENANAERKNQRQIEREQRPAAREKAYSRKQQSKQLRLRQEIAVENKGPAFGITRNEKGFVYVMTNPAFPGWVKIGSTTDLQSRLAGYQTGDPHASFEYNHYKFFPLRKQVEAKLHLQFGNRRGTGEWFEISIEEAIDAIDAFVLS
jgi:hypothetical protein